MCAIAFISVIFVLKPPEKESSDWGTKLRRIDFLGAFILILAVSALLLGLDHGSNISWSAPITITSLCVSVPLEPEVRGVVRQLHESATIAGFSMLICIVMFALLSSYK